MPITLLILHGLLLFVKGESGAPGAAGEGPRYGAHVGEKDIFIVGSYDMMKCGNLNAVN